MQTEPLLNDETSAQLDKNIKLLTENATIPLSDLSRYPEVDTSYTLVKSIASILYENNEYSSLLTLLKKNKPKNIVISPGTVGAFLYGCLINEGVTPECTPACVGSLPSSNDISPCRDQVWVMNSNGQLEQLTTGGTSAIVYGDHITNQQVSQLAASGVTSYSLATKGKNGKYQQGPIHQIDATVSNYPDPVNMGQTMSVPAQVAQQPNQVVQPAQPVEVVAVPANNNAGWIIAVIIIIIIIILVVWWMNRKKSQSALIA